MLTTVLLRGFCKHKVYKKVMTEQNENKETGAWLRHLFEMGSPVTGKSTGKGKYDDFTTPRKKDKNQFFCYFSLFVRHHYPLITAVMVFVIVHV
jgi:hypothetical protein